MDKLYRRVLLTNPIVLLIFIFIVPFFIFMAIGLMNLILAFTVDDLFFYLPHDESLYLLLHVVYFIWMRMLCVHINQMYADRDSRLFRACFIAYFLYVVYPFLSVAFTEFPRGWTTYNAFISGMLDVYGLFTIFSFFYMAWFGGKVINDLPPMENPSYYERMDFPKAMALIVYPIGIPLLHRRVRQAAQLKGLFGMKGSEAFESQVRKSS